MRRSTGAGPSDGDTHFWEYRRRKVHHNLPFDVQRWSHLLLPSSAVPQQLVEEDDDADDQNDGVHTFQTHHFPLSYDEAVAFVHHFRVVVLNRSREEFTDEDQAHLSAVEHRLQTLMDDHPCESGGFFVRLGSRSPKDSIFLDDLGLGCCERFKRTIFEKLVLVHQEKIGEEEEEVVGEDQQEETTEKDQFSRIDTVVNQEMVALMVSTCESLKVETAIEAMEMLKHSQRVYSDLLLLGDFEDLYSESPMELIIREWVSDMPYQFELRGFVKDNKLNALTQYDDKCYFADLARQKEEVGERIRQYFDTCIAHRLEAGGFSDYVCDFGVRENGQCIVIELNSFDVAGDEAKSGTGASLFSWTRDSDVLLNGPFEFRVIEAPPLEALEGHIPPDWLAVVVGMRDQILAGEREYGCRGKKTEEEMQQAPSSEGTRKCIVM